MVALLEEMMRSIELWLRIAKKATPVANPNLDPVILIPGIAGSILNAVDDEGNEERVWVRLLRADHEFRMKLWSRFDPSTGRTVSMDEKSRIIVPEDRYGLYAIDVLDPDMVIGQEGVCYYHDLIEQMIKWGYQEGKTLFGFGYDFRQSNRLQETLDRFLAKLESVFTSSGGKKINLITHSMGGLLVKCFMSLHSDKFEKYVKSWIAIGTPFQGAPGYITTALLNGCSFVEGWEQNFFISKWSMQQLLIECPSIYELMASPSFCWDSAPLLQIWRGKHDDSNDIRTLLESYELTEMLPLMEEALSGNMVEVDGKKMQLPLNLEILKWADETREILSRAKLPPTVKFYNIYGTHYDTPHSVCYGSEHAPISDLKQLLSAQAKYIYVNGDGTVPAESGKADGLDAVARVGVPADHRGIVSDRHVFRIVKHWLNAGEPDPLYNPLNDYVVLPTAFEIEKHSAEKGGGLQVTTLKEEWVVISPDSDIDDDSAAAMVGGAFRFTSIEEEQQQLQAAAAAAAAAAAILIHPQSEEVQTMGITMSA